MPRANIVKKAKNPKERESFRLCHLCLVARYMGTAQGKLQAKFSHVNLLYIQLAKLPLTHLSTYLPTHVYQILLPLFFPIFFTFSG